MTGGWWHNWLTYLSENNFQSYVSFSIWKEREKYFRLQDHLFRLHTLHWFHPTVCEIISLSNLIQDALLQTMFCFISHSSRFLKLSVPQEEEICLLLIYVGYFFVFYLFTQTMNLIALNEFWKFWKVHAGNMP